jgi:hypothetical protein
MSIEDLKSSPLGRNLLDSIRKVRLGDKYEGSII